MVDAVQASLLIGIGTLLIERLFKIIMRIKDSSCCCCNVNFKVTPNNSHGSHSGDESHIHQSYVIHEK